MSKEARSIVGDS